MFLPLASIHLICMSPFAWVRPRAVAQPRKRPALFRLMPETYAACSSCLISANSLAIAESAQSLFLLIFSTAIRFCRSGGISNSLAAYLDSLFLVGSLNGAEMFGTTADYIDLPVGH
jgi:hypothetical protein